VRYNPTAVINLRGGGTGGRALRKATSLWVVSAFLVAVALLPAAAVAKPKHGAGHGGGGGAKGPKRIAVTSAEGGGAAEGPVRAQVARALARVKMKAIPQKKGGAPTDDQQWVALGQKLKADGFVQLSFEGERGKQSVEITVRTGSDGSALGSETFAAKGPPAKLAAVVGKGFWKKLGAAVKQTTAAAPGETTGMPARDLAHEENAPTPETPAEPETPPVAAPEAAAPEAPPEPPEHKEPPVSRPHSRPPVGEEGPPETTGRGHREPALLAAAQLRYLRRTFTYAPSSAVTGATVNSPTVGVEVSWFPITNFGLTAGGDFEKWMKLVKQFPTTMLDVHGALVFRLPLSFGELYVQAGVFRHSFSAADDGSGQRVNVSLPDTTYFGGRAGAGLDVRLGESLSLLVDANYRLVTSLGAGDYGVKSALYFPNAKAGVAFDAGLMLALHLNRMFEVQLGGDIRRYAITTNATATDRVQATGATDMYLAGWIGLGGAFGGH